MMMMMMMMMMSVSLWWCSTCLGAIVLEYLNEFKCGLVLKVIK